MLLIARAFALKRHFFRLLLLWLLLWLLRELQELLLQELLWHLWLLRLRALCLAPQIQHACHLRMAAPPLLLPSLLVLFSTGGSPVVWGRCSRSCLCCLC